MTEHISIATANTQMGRLLSEPGALGAVAHSDILLMQEVTLEADELSQRLGAESDLRVAHFDPEFGLAIAAKPAYEVTDTADFLLRGRGPIGKSFEAQDRFETTKFRLRGRGLISAEITTPNDNTITVVTTHPTVPFKFQARSRQIRDIPIFLGSDNQEPLVLAGDMNHWPGPRWADIQMARMARLNQVELDEQPTFDISKSKYAWLGKMAGLGFNPNGQLDAMYYRGAIHPMMTNLRPIASDHKAIIAGFEFTNS